MMNRRKFLQALGLGIVSTTLIGKLIPTAPKKPSVSELDIVFKSTPIVAKTRKLKAVYTFELAEDLKVFHGRSL